MALDYCFGMVAVIAKQLAATFIVKETRGWVQKAGKSSFGSLFQLHEPMNIQIW